MNVNKVFIVGNLTRDPELRTIPSGQAVASFAVATNRQWNDAAGQKQQEVEFHNIVAWGRLAEIVNQYSKKGNMIFVEGRLRTRSWQTPQGEKRSRTEVVAERIQLGPRPGGSRAAPESGFSQPTPPEVTPVVEYEDKEDVNVSEIPF